MPLMLGLYICLSVWHICDSASNVFLCFSFLTGIYLQLCLCGRDFVWIQGRKILENYPKTCGLGRKYNRAIINDISDTCACALQWQACSLNVCTLSFVCLCLFTCFFVLSYASPDESREKELLMFQSLMQSYCGLESFLKILPWGEKWLVLKFPLKLVLNDLK